MAFLSNQKIYEIYKIITSNPLDAVKLERIIFTSLFFIDKREIKIPSDQLAQVHQDVFVTYESNNYYYVLQVVNNCLPNLHRDMNEPFNMDEPFKVVGGVFQSVYEKFCNRSNNRMKTRSHSHLNYDSNHICLHLLTDCTNLKLYSTALHLLQDFTVVLAFQILTCTTVTTQEAVTLFFQRVKFLYNFRRFILIDVNVMSLKLQEVCFSPIHFHFLSIFSITRLL